MIHLVVKMMKGVPQVVETSTSIRLGKDDSDDRDPAKSKRRVIEILKCLVTEKDKVMGKDDSVIVILHMVNGMIWKTECSLQMILILG